MASRRMLLGDATAARSNADWLMRVGLFPPTRSLMPAMGHYSLPHPMVRMVVQPRDQIDLTLLRLAYGQPTTGSYGSLLSPRRRPPNS